MQSTVRGRAMLVGLVALLLVLPAQAEKEPESLLVFYSPDCRYCKYLKGTFLPALEKDFGVTVRLYDVEVARNLYYLEELEKNVREVGDELPVVFFRDSAIYGSQKIFKQLRPIIEQYQQGAVFNITYFTKSGCRECSRVDKILDVLVREHPNVAVHAYSINVGSNKLLGEALSESLGVPERQRLVAPTVFIGDHVLIKGGISFSKLETILKAHPFGIGDYADLKARLAALSEASIVRRFNAFGVLGVAGAGLLDGMNPCAFATIVFFISYLVFAGRRRRDIVVMSICFIVAVFLAYFVIGLGFYQALSLVAGIKIAARIIFVGFGLLAFVLAAVSVFDFVKALQGKLGEMKLQLPRRVKQKIHETIKEKTGSLGIGVGAFVVGVLISLFEFGCTGQVYLPTITYVVSNPALRARAVGLLALYNLMFIVPLVVISLLGVAFSSQRVGQFLKDRIAFIKLLTALLFVILGLLLILYS